jgi:hypothetical protein
MRKKPDFWKGDDRICWLCVLMQEFIGTNSLKHAPAIMSGMASILNAPTLRPNARQAIFNLRQISQAYVTIHSIKYAVAVYNDRHYRDGTQGPYQINAESLEFCRTDFLEDPQIAEARRILAEPLDYDFYSIQMADPRQSMSIAIGDESMSVRFPIGPIAAPLASRRTHDLERKPKGKIRIPLPELRELAVEMDERDARHPERRAGNWTKRFERIALFVPELGVGLREEKAIELDGSKHLLGLPGSGKTTILTIIAVWLDRRGYKVMMLFPSIEVARQYMAVLSFHGVKVGMLVGQNPMTRRNHADRLAEAIAASGGQGGFAYTLEGADSFAANCLLPAFSTASTDIWDFGKAPCQEIIQASSKRDRPNKCLCPVWTMCGRNKAPRDLLDANVWVGHVLSMDTAVPPQAIDERIRYFEFIARTFDAVVFDEADMVQSNLDSYGAATLNLSGAEDSVHRVIQEQIHGRFARGDNYRLFDRSVELYSRDLSEFGNHNTSLIAAVQNVSKQVSDRFENQLLTASRVIGELLYKFEENKEDSEADDESAEAGFSLKNALRSFWDTAAYTAFYDRTNTDSPKRELPKWCADKIGINYEELSKQCDNLSQLFRRYLAEDRIEKRDKIIDEIAQLFLPLCFLGKSHSPHAKDVVLLLVCVTFTILGYQRIVPGTRSMVAAGLIREPIVESTASLEMRHYIPENLLGSLSGIKYSFSKARTNNLKARNVQLSYIAFVGAPRMLMHRFHRLLEADGAEGGPAVLMSSATSFLEASPAYHINVGPHYLLKTRKSDREPTKSLYRFKWIPDRDRDDKPLRYSGAGDLRERNLQCMVDALVRGGRSDSEIYKSMRRFDVREDGIQRKAAFVVNSYEQAREIKRFLDRYHPDVGRRTKAVVRFLEEGEKPSDYVTSAQCEALGDDESCDLIVFPMMAIGRGVNIVFTKGPRQRDAAIGSIYFLTRPHPSTDDMQLLYGLAGRATQEFGDRSFSTDEDLTAIFKEWDKARKGVYGLTRRLQQEPLMASRLGPELFKPFAANQMVAILQTIGRGMRNGCPVRVYFVDAAWAPRSAEDKTDSARYSMLVQMRVVLEECIEHPEPAIAAIYRELYGAFIEPMGRIENVKYPKNLSQPEGSMLEDDGFDDLDVSWEM